MTRPTIAALYVQKNGCYFGLPDVDPWDEERDARLYAGPHPVVAHPPCARWCRLAGLVESRYPHGKLNEIHNPPHLRPPDGSGIRPRC